MKVKFIRGTVAAKELVKIDDVRDLPEGEAKFLIGLGKAVAFADAAPEPDETTQAAPEILAGDPPRPAPKTKKKGNK